MVILGKNRKPQKPISAEEIAQFADQIFGDDSPGPEEIRGVVDQLISVSSLATRDISQVRLEVKPHYTRLRQERQERLRRAS